MHFCTIITGNYLSYALALWDSLWQFNTNIRLFVLVSEKDSGLRDQIENKYPGITILFHDELCNEGIGKAIYDKYYHTYMDGFRWSMKPVLLNYLMKEKAVEKVIYVDCDIQFYNDYTFLFDDLDKHDVLLTPHWRSSEGTVDQVNFMQLYIFGLYNAGFVGVNSNAIDIMDWWARANVFICTIDACLGQYVDQTHLNLMPVYFDGVYSLKHRGCNIASWNLIECKRVLRDGEVYINNETPVVFIHYSSSTISAIQEGHDPLLRPHLNTYFRRLKFFGNDLEAKLAIEKESKLKEERIKKRSLFIELKVMVKKILRKILIRS